MPFGVWGQRASSQGQGNLSQRGTLDAYSPYSAMGRHALGGGNPGYFGRGDVAVQKRQFADVGKVNINLANPLEPTDGHVPDYQAIDEDPSPLGAIGRYYDPMTPGGFFAGILGGIGQTVGGVFGPEGEKSGAQFGQTIGKTIEAPLGIVGGVGVPFIAPVIDKFNADIEDDVPYILKDTLKVPTNIGGAFQSMLNVFGLAGRAVERFYAGTDLRGQLPQDIKDRVASGELREEDQIDELVLSGRGFTNDQMHNLLLSLVTDPANWLSGGLGAVGGAVRGTGAVARTFSAASRAGDLTALAARGGDMADLVRRAAVAEDVLMPASRAELGLMRQAVSGGLATRGVMPGVRAGLDDTSSGLQLRLVERMGMSALGPVDPKTANTVLRIGNHILRATDPVNFFSGSRAGQRSMEQLRTSSSTGLVAALHPGVVNDLLDVADSITGDGADRVGGALGVWVSNAMQEVGASEFASDAMRTGAVAKVSTLNPTELSRYTLMNKGFDSNLGKYVELHIEKTKDLTVGTLPYDQMYNQTVAKLAAILEVDPSLVAQRLTKVDQDTAIAVHGAYYYAKGAKLHTDVVAGLRASTTPLPSDINPDTLTMISPRTLTKLKAKDLRAVLKTGNVDTIRATIERFDDFNWVNRNNVTDADLKNTITGWLDEAEPTLVDEINLIDPNTGQLRAQLPEVLRDWASDAQVQGYGLGNKMGDDLPLEALWRVTRDKKGNWLNANPWMDFWAEGSDPIKKVSRWERLRMATTRSVRQERILWSQRRRFITDMAQMSDENGVALPPKLSERIFEALMYEAKERYIQPRGMEPREMMGAVKKVIDDARNHSAEWDNLAGRLTERQVVLGFLRAMEGDVRLVGGTQKLTGGVKARAPGAAANYWGQISERLYPLMRFTLNPVFQAMELTEPYIFNYMRGIRTPLRRNSQGFQEGLASRNATHQLITHSDQPDGMIAETAEALALGTYQHATAAAKFGRRSWWSRWGTHTAERKDAALGLEVRRIIGDNLHAAFKEIKGDQFERFWADLEYQFGSVDRATVAERWLAQNLSLQDMDGNRVGLVSDLMNPKNIGQRLRLSKDGRKGVFTFGDVEEVLDSVMAELPTPRGLYRERRAASGAARGDTLIEDLRTMSRSEWAEVAEEAGLTARMERSSLSTVDDIWRLANGPERKAFWKGYRDTFLRGVKSATGGRPETRRLRDIEVRRASEMVKAWAKSMDMSEDEYIALHFEDIPRYETAAPFGPLGLTDIRPDWALRIYSREVVPTVRTWDISIAHQAGEAHAADELLRQDADQFYYMVVGERKWRNMMSWVETEDGLPPPALSQGYGDSFFADPMRAVDEEAFDHGVVVRVPRSHFADKDLMPGLDDGQVMPRNYVWAVAEEGLRPSGAEVLGPTGWSDVHETRIKGLSKKAVLKQAKDPELKALYNPVHGTAAKTAGNPIDLARILTVEERAVTHFWEGESYAAIQTYHRGVALNPDAPQFLGMSDERIEDMTAELDSAIAKGHLTQPSKLWRGINASRPAHEFGNEMTIDYGSIGVGDVFADPGYQAFTDDLRTATGFSSGGGHVYTPGSDHVGVVLHASFPAGFRLNVIGGDEAEHLIGRNVPFRVTHRWEGTAPGGGKTIHLEVAPVGDEVQPGVQRLILPDPRTAERNANLLVADATHNVDGLRTLASTHEPAVVARTEGAIADAARARPSAEAREVGGRRFGALAADEVAADIVDRLPPDTVRSYAEMWADFRGRVSELLSSSGMADEDFGDVIDPTVVNGNDGRFLAALAMVLPQNGTRKAFNIVLSQMNAMWQRGLKAVPEAGGAGANEALLATISTHLLRGVKEAIGQPTMTNQMSDALDVLSGNTTRRATGRTEMLQPIVSDDAAFEAAGYLTQGAIDDLAAQGVDVSGLVAQDVTSAYAHEYLVGFYNDVARHLNETGAGGYRRWTAADAAALAGRAREEAGRDMGVAPAVEEIDRQLGMVMAEIYAPPGSRIEYLNPILDLLNQKRNHRERHMVMTEVATELVRRIRDTTGVIIDDFDDVGVGIWDGATPQSMVPLYVMSDTSQNLNVADMLAYAMEQEEVWGWRVGDVDEDVIARVGNWGDYQPRVEIVVPEQTTNKATEAVATKLAKQLPFAKGATAAPNNNGTWSLYVIDDGGLLARDASGAVDKDWLGQQIDEAALPNGFPDGLTYGLAYGHLHKAGPRRLPDGTADWNTHLDAATESLRSRGSALTAPELDGLRSAYQGSVERVLADIAPKNVARRKRGEPITRELEDRRSGQVLGTTTPRSVTSAVVRGFGAADAVTGIHELVHIFSRAGMDPSLREAVSRSWDEYTTHVESLASDLDDRAAAATTKSVASRYRNRANALRAGIGTPDGTAWGTAQEEHFVRLVLSYIDRGVPPTPEMRNAIEHFRNWVKLTQNSINQPGMPPVQVSPAMQAKLNRMFSRPGIETVPYNAEDAAMRMAAMQTVRSSWDEAHATHFYKRDRSMMERSINHPYIGLYPASYMWGKVLPEMLRFLALRPFGMETPFLTWNVAREIGDTIRAQSETDESFRQFLSDNEDAFMLFSMFFPGLPQDIPANASLPLRRIAEQGLENQVKFAQGMSAEEVKDIDYAKGAGDAMFYALGPAGTVRTVNETLGMAGDLARSTAAQVQGEMLPDQTEFEPLPVR
jgi:hypothetical protein